MKEILILDCTLRDGGYVNNNNFGYDNISKIISALNKSKIDIIECGYIKDDKKKYSKDVTEYKSYEIFKEDQKENLNKNKKYTLMLLGEKYNIYNLPKSKSKNNIIRMTFHKKSINKALEYANIIHEKGYKLFIQPTVTKDYADDEIINFIKEVNAIKPYCVGIVDTFGEMTKKDVLRLCDIYDKYLNRDILVGFHAHNNLQLAFSNAITFINKMIDKRSVIIDTSIYGMGRGAGNLPTELLVSYLNDNYDKKYNIDPLLRIADEVICKIKDEYNWGYSLEYYLSAVNSIHPSYVINFMNRKTLNTQDISKLLNLISYDKKKEYNEKYADELYNMYNNNHVDDKKAYAKLKKIISGKKVLLIGPGLSIKKYKSKIEELLSDKEIVSISVNNKLMFKTDYIFISNKKRYENLKRNKHDKIIITSNIKKKSHDEIVFDYKKSLSKEIEISDNSFLVILNIVSNITDSVLLAGFDGFSVGKDKNYYDSNIQFILDKNYAMELNEFIKKNLKEYMKKMKIETITPSMYIRRKNENNSNNTRKI